MIHFSIHFSIHYEEIIIMMIGLMFAFIAGSLVSLQNIFNSKVDQHVGSWVTTTLVLGLGFAASLTLGLLSEGGDMFALEGMQTWYWFSGLVGIGVVTCLMNSIRILGPTLAISIVMTSQLVFALFLDSMGWLGLQQVPFTFNKLAGVLLMAAGIYVFKWKGRKEAASVSI